MRELTKEEQDRLLTQEQVNILLPGMAVCVKWDGGNGPHVYWIIRKENDEVPYTLTAEEAVRQLQDRNGPVHTGRLYPVGTERCQVRVFLPL